MLTDLFIRVLEIIGPWVFINVRSFDYFESIFMFFGIHDILLLSLMVIIYSRFLKSKRKKVRGLLFFTYVILFLYLIPLFAATFEAQRVLYFEKINGDLIDGFNLLYAWLRFPQYWIIGIGIIITNYFLSKKRATTKK